MITTKANIITVWRETLAGENIGKFGESFVICQTKTIQIINNLLADLLIHQTFFHQMLKKNQFAKLSPRQIFPLYGSFCLTSRHSLLEC